MHPKSATSASVWSVHVLSTKTTGHPCHHRNHHQHFYWNNGSHNCNVTNSVVIVVALKQPDLVPLLPSHGETAVQNHTGVGMCAGAVPPWSAKPGVNTRTRKRE